MLVFRCCCCCCRRRSPFLPFEKKQNRSDFIRFFIRTFVSRVDLDFDVLLVPILCAAVCGYRNTKFHVYVVMAHKFSVDSILTLRFCLRTRRVDNNDSRFHLILNASSPFFIRLHFSLITY